MKILMVCLGNICRSPMADALLRKKVSDLHLDIHVDSAGTSALHSGEKPDKRMIATGAKFGVDLNPLRARQFVASDFEQFDLIYVMDKNNFRNVIELAKNEDDKRKVKLILNELHPDKNLEVPDPYYGGEEGFIDVYNMLNDATDRIIDKLTK
jgi:protein-tyrosine phosphatase